MRKFSLTLLLLILIFIETMAQEKYSSASVTSQKNRNNQNIPQSKEIVVEEYMNFHTHNIRRPQGKENVALDLRWGNNTLHAKQEEAVLQLGLATKEVSDFSKIPPMNISLIIDNSGSMQGYNKMEKVKEALYAFIQKLRPQDIVSVVVFNSSAQVVIPAQNVKKLKFLETSIENIYAGGGTNINEGLVKGYQELLKNYDENKTNRVLLLTDGQANVGEIDPEIITSNPIQQNIVKSINLWAIGVGVEYNSDLLRQLVKSTGGQIHFIANEEDVKKVFIKEIESLLFPIGQKAKLEIVYDKNLEIDEFFGYQPAFVDNKIILHLENFNAGLTQVILTRFKLKSGSKKDNYEVKVRLVYEDLQKKEQVVKEERLKLFYKEAKNYPVLEASADYKKNYILTYSQQKRKKNGSLLSDEDVKKNYVIAYLAQALKDMAKTYNEGNHIQAKAMVDFALKEVENTYRISQEKDVKMVFDILKKYQNILKNHAKYEDE